MAKKSKTKDGKLRVLEKIKKNTKGISVKELIKDKKLNVGESLLRKILKQLEEDGNITCEIKMRDQDHRPNPLYKPVA